MNSNYRMMGDVPCPLCINHAVADLETRSPPHPFDLEAALRERSAEEGPYLRWRCNGGCEVKVRTVEQITRYGQYFRFWFRQGQKEARRKAGPK